jgi:nitrate/TMAO reductase-like tetraheme cytochrome c subunit
MIEEMNAAVAASQVALMQAQYQLSFGENNNNNYDLERRLELNRQSRQRRMEDPEYRKAEQSHSCARQAAARQRNSAQSQAHLEGEPGKWCIPCRSQH